jgi:DNA repair protein RadC
MGMKTKHSLSVASANLYCREHPYSIQPREHLAMRGVEYLSDLDLVQAMLGSGMRGKPVRLLAAEVLALLESQSNPPGHQELMGIKGMGRAKSTLICSALELARRFYLPERRRIRQPADVLPLIRHYADREQELFLSLSLNGAHEVMGCRVVSMGLVNRALAHPREIYAEAITQRASSLIVAHNHPSGCLDPSDDDREVTRRLKAAGDLLGITLLDHLIFSDSSYWSFAERGLV